MYYNVISDESRIFTNSVFDDSNSDPIYYPTLTTINTWNLIWDNYNQVRDATKYILVIKTWPVFNNDGSVLVPELTKTLTYTKPAQIIPNLKIDGYKIVEPGNNDKVIYDSYNPGQYPNPKFVQFSKNYLYTIFIKKEGNVAVNNVNVNWGVYDSYWGNYPNFGPRSWTNSTLNFSATESIKSVTFFKNIPNFSTSTVNFGAVFHVDRNNSISETNENDNYLFFTAPAYPIGTILKNDFNESISNENNSKTIVVDVLDENGKLIKTSKISVSDKNFNILKKELGRGNYFFKVDNKITRIKSIKKFFISN